MDLGLPLGKAVPQWRSCVPTSPGGGRCPPSCPPQRDHRRLISGSTSSITLSSAITLPKALSRRASSCPIVSPSRPSSAYVHFLAHRRERSPLDGRDLTDGYLAMCLIQERLHMDERHLWCGVLHDLRFKLPELVLPDQAG